MYALGDYYDRKGGSNNITQAIEYFKKGIDLANSNDDILHPSFEFILGGIYLEGREGINKNISEAIKYYKMAVAADRSFDSSVKSAMILSRIYLKGKDEISKDIHEALKYLEFAAHNGFSPEPSWMLAQLYSGNMGVERDNEKFEKYLTMAAENRHPKALLSLRKINAKLKRRKLK